MVRDYPDRPIVGIGVVVLKGDDVLLIRRGKAPRAGQWSLPGGAQKLGETVFEAARREVLEECGVTIAAATLLDVVDSIDRDDDGRVRFHYTLIDFGADWRGGDPVAGSDAAAAQWVSLAALDDLKLWAETVRIVGLAVARRSATG